MRYFVTFQELAAGAARPTDWPSSSDFETDEKGFALLPSVGDFVDIVTPDKDSPTYAGKVRSRLFTYFNSESCRINIIIETGSDDDDWGKLIKE